MVVFRCHVQIFCRSLNCLLVLLGQKLDMSSIPFKKVSSQIFLKAKAYRWEIMDKLGVVCLDMEAASICQILNQTGAESTNRWFWESIRFFWEVPILILKVVTNEVYPHDASRMEMEYKQNISDASSEAVKTLSKILHFIENRRLSELWSTTAEFFKVGLTGIIFQRLLYGRRDILQWISCCV